MVTTAEAEAILQEQKVIAVNVNWRLERRGFRLEATVLAIESKLPLRLVGYVGLKNRSFALLFNNLPIRKYTAHDKHVNPNTGEPYRISTSGMIIGLTRWPMCQTTSGSATRIKNSLI